jgi:hypothetical protein
MRKLLVGLGSCFFAGLLLLGTGTAIASAPCDVSERATADQKPGAVFRKLMQDHCLADPSADPSELVKQVTRALDPESPTNKDYLRALAKGGVSALTLLSTHAEAQEAKATGGLRAQWIATRGALARALADSAGLEELSSKDLAKKAESIIEPTLVKYSGDRSFEFKIGSQVIDFACARSDSAETCDQFESRLELWRVYRLSFAVFQALQNPENARRAESYQLKLARWAAYREQSLHQAWWELAINGYRLNNDEKLCRRERGVRMGLCEVPTSQLIVFHPDVGLRFSKNANGTNELKPHLVVELIGRYQFSWKAAADSKASLEDKATVDSPWGYSLAAAYGLEGDRNRWSFGPMLRWKGYNLAVTRSQSGRWSLLMSTSLSNSFFQKEREWSDKLQKAGL